MPVRELGTLPPPTDPQAKILETLTKGEGAPTMATGTNNNCGNQTPLKPHTERLCPCAGGNPGPSDATPKLEQTRAWGEGPALASVSEAGRNITCDEQTRRHNGETHLADWKLLTPSPPTGTLPPAHRVGATKTCFPFSRLFWGYA